jgi:hypothetical protein
MLTSARAPAFLLALAAALLAPGSAQAGDAVNANAGDSAVALTGLIKQLASADTVELRLLSPAKSYAITFATLQPAEDRALSDSCIYAGRQPSDIAALIAILNASLTRVQETPANFGGEFAWTMIFKQNGRSLNRLFVRAGVVNGRLTGVLQGGQFEAVPQISARLEAWAERPNLILARNVEAGQYPQYGNAPAVPDSHGRRPCTKWKG